MRTGLLGGAFDPPHNGHLAVARSVRDALALDRVDLLVTGQSPHASGKQIFTAVAHRLAMARLCAEIEPGLGVQDIETRHPGKSYSVETLRRLRATMPAGELFFIIGGDTLADLPNWREPEECLALAQFVPVFRPGNAAGVFEQLQGRLSERALEQLRRNLVEVPQLDISSTAIRAAVAAGESISQWVPPAIEAYIRAHRLYA